LKRYFLASDIAEFSKYKTEIDDQIKNKDLSFFNLVYTRFDERMEDVKKIYPEVLNEPFDFSKQESINVDYDNLAYAKYEKELKARWMQQLKCTTLSGYYDLVEDQKNKKKGIAATNDEDDETDVDVVEAEEATLDIDGKSEPPRSLAEFE